MFRFASSSSRLHDDADEGIQWVFSHYSQKEKSGEVPRLSSARVPASLSSSELSSHQMAPAKEFDESGEDETGGRLVRCVCGFTAVAAAEGVEERAQTEAAMGATVQQTVEIPVVDVPMLFCDKFQQSTSSS